VSTAVSNLFNDWALAAGYAAWYETEGRAADLAQRALLGWLLAGFSDVRSALEIGTGTGHFAGWLTGLGWQVIGVDISLPMLTEAVKRGGAQFVGADAMALPFATRAFDVALLITMLGFLSDPALARREMARIARRGIVLGVLNRWHPLAWQRKRSGLPLWQAAHFYSPIQLTRLARRALGVRAGNILWRTTLLPRPFSQCASDTSSRRFESATSFRSMRDDASSRLPFGAFIGLRAELHQEE